MIRVLGYLALVLVVAALAAAWYLTRADRPTLPDTRGMTGVARDALQVVTAFEIPAAGVPAAPKTVLARGRWFTDRAGRVRLLRGVNLGGSSKVPFAPPLPTHVPEGFFDGANVSFIGRPFPLAEADEHFARLRAWGFRFVRLLTTWEAIEHAGPGIYDAAYLDYLHEVARKAGEHGIDVFLDPHQDVWSRFSGGDGAPLWTFEKVGLDVTRFKDTGAAIVHNTHGDPFPQMVWFTNNQKYAAATMFTLFFGGDRFAPGLDVDGVPVQQYLQDHYVEAIRQAALRLRDLPNVIGIDTMNEPSPGYIGQADLSRRAEAPLGVSPTYFEGMALASGHPHEVPEMALGTTGFKEVGRVRVNDGKATAFLPGHSCVWRAHGVWDVDTAGTPVLRRPEYFVRQEGRDVDFLRDHFTPFLDRMSAMLREVDPGYLVFVEAPVNMPPPKWGAPEPGRVVHAPHWYDFITLVSKRSTPFFSVDIATARPVIGAANVTRLFTRQLGDLARHGHERLGEVPTLLGEFGIPMDMHDRASYRSGDFARQDATLDRSMQAVERNLLSYTLWNYTADNTNERGDQWNGEDLSIWSRDQVTGTTGTATYAGGRGIRAAVRPHPYAIAGVPLRSFFDLKTRTFVHEFEHDDAAQGPTEIVVPRLHYANGYQVFVSDGTAARARDAGAADATGNPNDVVLYRHDTGRRRHTVVIK